MPTVHVATFDGPGSPPVIREVPKPEIPRKAALIRIAACGVCGTDLHILKGHWPFTLGHELAGVISEIGDDLTEDFMGQPLEVGSKVMLRDRYPWSEMQTRYPFTEEGIGEAVKSAIEMRSVKSTIVPAPDLIGD